MRFKPRCYKFGVLLAFDDQKEDEMFGNRKSHDNSLLTVTPLLTNDMKESTPEFEEFLECLGEKVELHGWSGFRGGLDVKSLWFYYFLVIEMLTNTTSDKSTGSHSIYTKYNSFEIMYHVSTLLPYFPNDPQQLGMNACSCLGCNTDNFDT